MKKKNDFIEAARKEWPPIFALSKIAEISGGIFGYQTIHNYRSRGTIPQNIFARHRDKKIIIHRDKFLDWMEKQVNLDSVAPNSEPPKVIDFLED